MDEAKLVMFRAAGDRRDFVLAAGRTLIGRKNDCAIRIPLSEISRHHTEITIEGDRIQLKDLGSANGTFVNNKRVQTVKLAAGDHVIIGPVVFTLQIDGQPEEVRPVKTKVKRTKAASVPKDDPVADAILDDDLDPISALEALASSADQTAIDPFEDEETEVAVRDQSSTIRARSASDRPMDPAIAAAVRRYGAYSRTVM